MEESSFVSKDSCTGDHGQVCAADKLLCNICDLEPVRDPVVTSCGHLYCWPCLNKRLQNQSQKHCSACASPLIHSANFIKIYGTDSEPLDEPPGLQCCICLESPPPTNAVASSCGHVFCWPCLYQWLHTHHHDQGPCPVCKNVLKMDAHILPIYGNHEVHAGNDVSSNVGTVTEVANSGGFIIPPRPSPPVDAFALSSRKYATSDDELEGGAGEFDESEDEFNFPENDDRRTSNEPYEVLESLLFEVRRELGERRFRRLEPELRGLLGSELLQLLRSLAYEDS